MAAWFKRTQQETQGTPKKVVIAEGLWIKCESCKEIMYRVEVEKAGRDPREIRRLLNAAYDLNAADDAAAS